MYCLYTIISLLLGKSFYEVCVNVVHDDIVNALRDVLFATETPRKELIEKALKLLPTSPFTERENPASMHKVHATLKASLVKG